MAKRSLLSRCPSYKRRTALKYFYSYINFRLCYVKSTGFCWGNLTILKT